MSVFRWTKNREKAALSLANGDLVREAADKAGVSDRTVYRWLNQPEFAIEVDRLTHMTSIAVRAERLRIAMRVVKGRTDNTQYPQSKADLLDWLKFVQSETDGVKLDLAALFEANAQMAGTGSARILPAESTTV
jgi:transposase-like protein